MSSLRRGHANLLCIVPILTDDPRRESTLYKLCNLMYMYIHVPMISTCAHASAHVPVCLYAHIKASSTQMMRGWRNTVGNLIGFVGLKNNYRRPQFTDICAKHRGLRFHRIRDSKQYVFFVGGGKHNSDTRESDDDRKIQNQSFAPASRGPKGQLQHTSKQYVFDRTRPISHICPRGAARK